MLNNLSLRYSLEDGRSTEDFPELRTAEDVMRIAFREADKKSTDGLALRITRRMIGTGQTKLESYSPESVAMLADQVSAFIKRDLPIPVVSAVGARKFGAETLEDFSPDLAEVLAMSVLGAMTEAVQEIYPQGLSFRLIQEDAGGMAMSRSTLEHEQGIDRYSTLNTTLTDTLSEMDGIDIHNIRESTLIEKTGTSIEQFGQQMEPLADLFLHYLHDSAITSEGEWSRLPSFRALHEQGWMGTIPLEMRAHYHRRIQNVYGVSPQDRTQLNMRLSQLFAAILLRKQKGILEHLGQFGSEFQDHADTLKPLRGSFAQPTPGMPTAKGRFFWRIPRKYTTGRLPYWCGFGVNRETEDGAQHPMLLDRREIPVGSMVKGSLELVANSTATVRANAIRTINTPSA